MSKRQRENNLKYSRSAKGKAKRKEYYLKHKDRLKRAREAKKVPERVPTLDEIVNDPILGPSMRRSLCLETKKKTSEYFLTINTNRKYLDCSDEFKRKFLDFMIDMFSNEGILFHCLVDVSSDSDDNNVIFFENVSSKNLNWRIEVGRRQYRLHAHALISLEHTGEYIFDGSAFRELLLETFGYKLHFKVDSHPNKVKNWVNYISKDDRENTVVLYNGLSASV